MQDGSFLLASSLPVHLIDEKAGTGSGEGACLTSNSESATRTLVYGTGHCFPDQIPASFILEVCLGRVTLPPLSPSFLLCEGEGDGTTLWGCGEDEAD